MPPSSPPSPPPARPSAVKILVVDDDKDTSAALAEALSQHHYQVSVAADGQTALSLAQTWNYDLILLDWLLPSLDGLSVCCELRSHGYQQPILLLTAKDAHADIVAGLDAGADDYVVKPYYLPELLARIRALLRRGNAITDTILHWGDLQLNPIAGEVTYQGQEIALTAKEYQLLELFLRNPQRVFSRSAIIERLWSFEDSPSDNAITVHIKGLRRKLRASGLQDDIIETVYGLGYRLKALPDPWPTPPSISSLTDDTDTRTIQTVLEQHRATFLHRVDTMQRQAQHLRQDATQTPLQSALHQEAHKLAGSLGCFGFPEGTQIARTLEQSLAAESPLADATLTQLLDRLDQLRAILHQPLPSTITAATKSTFSATPLEIPVLLISPNEELVQHIQQEVSPWDVQLMVTVDMEAARQSFASASPQLALLDLNDQPLATVLASVRELSRHMPVVGLLDQQTLEVRVKLIQAGAQAILQSVTPPSQILVTLVQVLNTGLRPAEHLLIVDDDLHILDHLHHILQPWGFHLGLLDHPTHFWTTLEDLVPDLLILDIEMPDISGIELCQAVRNHPHWHDLPVLFLSAHGDPEQIQQSFLAGADDFVRKPVIGPELVARILTRLEHTRSQRQLPYIDDLTGLSNRRRGTEDLQRLLRLAQRQQQEFSLALVAIDPLSACHHQHSHELGNHVLSYLGQLLQQRFRQEDVLCRWNSDTLVVGLYGISQPHARQRLLEVFTAFQQQHFQAEHHAIQAVCRAGLAIFPHHGQSVQTLYQAASAALGRAQATNQCLLLADASSQRLPMPQP
ncbi:two-component system response regulator/CreB family protein [Halomicronema hongdechloris C2206]|uniref:Two-component system response regulator/CreB family protein n=1 Tax=Halomicronema hongdechloris C2206 TaxID=1641165 RepID=A0A1Z3HIW8_9CYAN|nr:response regulator [Halomicronema hongdechloris]ASC70240.1 two-component system response regulator/CreB family protein [Halomicronema hongdechloris C2206]